MGWNPDDYDGGSQGAGAGDGERDERVIPSGDYLLGIFYWKRVSQRSVKIGTKVLAGPLKGAVCFPLISTNVSEKKGSADRMFHICKAFNIRGELDFDDACFNGKFLGSAGKVKIQKKQDGKYTNHDIRRTFHRGEISQTERDKLTEWEEAYASTRSSSGGGGDHGWPDGDPGPSGDDGFPADDFADDDIPF